MTETQFRIKHSEIIEYYQLIEMRLKFICAYLTADEERGWFNKLEDYEYDSFGALIHKVEAVQEQQKCDILKKEDLEVLYATRKARNYWVHQCFNDRNAITFRDGEVVDIQNWVKLASDLNSAMEWDEKIAEQINHHIVMK